MKAPSITSLKKQIPSSKPAALDFEKGPVVMPVETPSIPGEEDKRFS
jgi:hypothetical protein